MSRRRLDPRTVLVLLALTLVAAAAANVMLGSHRLSCGQVLATLAGRGDWSQNLLVLQVRLPRLTLGILIGACVAVSGVILQGISRNELASPDTLGINAGAGLGMMLLLTMVPTAAADWPLALPLVAMAGALATTALVFALAYRRGSVLPARLLLVGIALGFGGQAVMLLLSLRMSFAMYSYVLTWMSGTLGGADWRSILFLLPWPLVVVPWLWYRSRTLDALALGDGVAVGLGVAVERDRVMLTSAATVLTSVCVAIGGHIGFLGLAAPHLARRLVGRRHGPLLAAAAFVGAILLVVADGLARHLLAPVEIPAGVLVGVLGGAYFLYLLATTAN
jgi:iron complex transport system permease protein